MHKNWLLEFMGFLTGAKPRYIHTEHYETAHQLPIVKRWRLLLRWCANLSGKKTQHAGKMMYFIEFMRANHV
jgi:hypothetical protein